MSCMIINDYNLLPPDSLPDHSVLSATFVTSHFSAIKHFQQNRSLLGQIFPQPHPVVAKAAKKNLSKIDSTFMMSDEIQQKVNQTIFNLESQVESKCKINSLWCEIKNIFLSQLSCLPDIPQSNDNKMNRNFRKGKAFWNNELEYLWAVSCNFEKKYLKFKVKTRADQKTKSVLRLDFKDAQNTFDKKYRYYKRLHHKNEYMKLEYDAKNNPTAMWAALKKLNNPLSTKAALEVINADGSISRDTKEVLSRWFQDISKLYSGLQDDPEMAYQEEFYNEVLNKKAEFERLNNIQPEDDNTGQPELNADISYD